MQGPIPFLKEEGDREKFDQFLQNLDMGEEFKKDRDIVSMLAKRFNAFDCKGRIAKIKTVEFRVKVKQNAHIPESTLIKYDPERKKFLREWVDECVKKDYLIRASPGQVKCAFSPVVVKKKTAPWFRVCANF